MTYSENKRKYNDKYRQEHVKRIPLDVQKEKYEEIKNAADDAGETVNGYIKKSIDMRLSSDKQAKGK